MNQPPSTLPLAVQDFYPTDVSHCYGCGRLNSEGHQIKTVWEGEGTIARYLPKTYHTSVPGFVYGGLIASLIDCHSMGTASAAAIRAGGGAIGDQPSPRYVTASLKVEYLHPTPLGPTLEVRGRITRSGSKSYVIEATVSADGVVTARGEVVAVRMPESMIQKDE